MKLKDSYLSRRRFLGNMLGGGLAALGAGAAVPLVQYSGNLRSEPPPDFLEISSVDYDLPSGTAKMVMYGRIPALIIKTPAPESSLKVLVAVCTHFDCTVSYKGDENRIFCACHEGYYDVDGRVLSGPPPVPLRHFYTRFKGDKLVIALERENLEKAFVASPT